MIASLMMMTTPLMIVSLVMMTNLVSIISLVETLYYVMREFEYCDEDFYMAEDIEEMPFMDEEWIMCNTRIHPDDEYADARRHEEELELQRLRQQNMDLYSDSDKLAMWQFYIQNKNIYRKKICKLVKAHATSSLKSCYEDQPEAWIKRRVSYFGRTLAQRQGHASEHQELHRRMEEEEEEGRVGEGEEGRVEEEEEGRVEEEGVEEGRVTVEEVRPPITRSSGKSTGGQSCVVCRKKKRRCDGTLVDCVKSKQPKLAAYFK
jgi:hypothetical protein